MVKADDKCYYELRQIKLGAQVFGIDLKENVSEEIRQVYNISKALKLKFVNSNSSFCVTAQRMRKVGLAVDISFLV